MSIAIGGMFAVNSSVITEPQLPYLCDQTGDILTDQNGNRLFVYYEGERRVIEDESSNLRRYIK